ncbi:MAG: deoxyribonuclease IV [Patescibacteria group bacterium]
MNKLSIGCHVSAAGGVWNAPKNAADLKCEVFQIFTRPPMGGPAPKLTDEIIEKFKEEMAKYYPLPSPPREGREGNKKYNSSPLRGEVRRGCEFVVHTPYFINFGSAKPRIYHGSVSVVREELERASLLGAKYVMTHLGSSKDLGQEKAFKQTKQGLKEVLKGYKGSTEFLLEIAAGAGSVIGDTFEELAELMEDLVKLKGFGGICFDTQHAFSGGYDLRNDASVLSTFGKFDKAIGLKWLKMSHMNDSKPDLGERKDRHDHIGEGKIGKKGFEAILGFFSSPPSFLKRGQGEFPLILETKHDKVKIDIKILKSLRESLGK